MPTYCIIRWHKKMSFGTGQYDAMIYTPELEQRADYAIIERDLPYHRAMQRRKELNDEKVAK
jgi:hypothetical protein